MKRSIFFATIVILTAVSIGFAQKPTNKTFTEPLEGIEIADVRIELGLAEVNISAGDVENLVRFDAYYDAEISDPDLRVNRRGNRASIDIRSDDNIDDRRMKRKRRNGIDQRYRVTLSSAPVIDLVCEVGLGESEIDLTNLKIERLSLDSGLSEMRLFIDEPNKVRADDVDISVGLGDAVLNNLGNLRFDRLNIDSGLGSVELDFRGFEGNAVVSVDVGMGSCTLILPKSVGAYLEYEESFLSSIDARGFDKVSRHRYESENIDQTESRLDIRLSVGMGSVDIRWRD